MSLSGRIIKVVLGVFIASFILRRKRRGEHAVQRLEC